MNTNAPLNEQVVIRQPQQDSCLMRVTFGTLGVILVAVIWLYPYNPGLPFLKTGVEIVGFIFAFLMFLAAAILRRTALYYDGVNIGVVGSRTQRCRVDELGRVRIVRGYRNVNCQFEDKNYRPLMRVDMYFDRAEFSALMARLGIPFVEE